MDFINLQLQEYLVNRRKLYGFDGGKEHQFIEIHLNTMIMNKIKNLWFDIKQRQNIQALETRWID